MGRYCQHCGQENIVSQQSFWSLLKHFVYDIFHFDGKFFDTLNSLLFKPGLVPKGYVQGKRNKYLDPIRMYLFTSALFFLVFFTLKKADTDLIQLDGSTYLTRQERFEVAAHVHEQLKTNSTDTTLQNTLNLLLDSTRRIQLIPVTANDTAAVGHQYVYQKDSLLYTFEERNVVRTDSLIEKGDNNWFTRRLSKKSKEFDEEFGDNVNKGAAHYLEGLLHKLPYLLFVSLPFFAAILKLLYVRNKNFYYSDHAVFTLYHYIISFILLLFVFTFDSLHDWLDWGFFSFMITVCLWAWPVYLFIAMRRFYGQGWGKTFGKFLLLNLLGGIVLSLLFTIFAFFSIFQL